MSETVAGSIRSLRGRYQSAALNCPVHDQSNSVTSAGAVPAMRAVTSLGRMSSQVRVWRSTWMPVSFSNSAAMFAPWGEGRRTVMDWPASASALSPRAGRVAASAAVTMVERMYLRTSLFSSFVCSEPAVLGRRGLDRGGEAVDPGRMHRPIEMLRGCEQRTTDGGKTGRLRRTADPPGDGLAQRPAGKHAAGIAPRDVAAGVAGDGGDMAGQLFGRLLDEGRRPRIAGL